MLAMAVVSTVLLVSGWEILCRARGFAPALDDTPDLWARTYERFADASPDQVVLIGSSRMLFDLDLEEFQRAAGGPRPIQLATVGTNELFMLEKLAADPHFRGTAIVSFVPGLTFLPERAATSIVKRAVERYEHNAISQRISARLWQWLDARLAFLNGDELTLRKLIEQLDLPQRAGAEGAALFLPYVHSVDEERRGSLFHGVETDAARREQIEANWVFPDPPSPEPPAQKAAEKEGLRHAILWREYAAVTRIRARGGRVIYVRFPSSGGVLQHERHEFPRETTWDALLAVTGAPGIHFEDAPELASFQCVEWSHLSATDSIEFTRRLMPLLLPHLRR
ncbi:MAG: hypothetical protein JWO36_1459 [Myxococcales bacterium]|nr:hypothetical protein [Myxococcales bacterium]